jgi:hypothetical protein
LLRGLSRFRLGGVFEGIGAGAQNFAFQAHCAPNKLPSRAAAQGETAPCSRGMSHLMVRGIAGRVKPARTPPAREGHGKELLCRIMPIAARSLSVGIHRAESPAEGLNPFRREGKAGENDA